MTIASVMTESLNNILLALTPAERWEAARQMGGNFMAQPWFIVVGVIAMTALTALLFVVSYRRTMQERNNSDQLFADYAEKRGLSEREREVLLDIAKRAKLKRNESIFTLNTAFDLGIYKMKADFAKTHTAEEKEQFRAVLLSLREKLGFKKQSSVSRGTSATTSKLSSRQIPIGKPIHLTRRKSRDSGNIEAAVVENNDNELSIKLEKSVTITFGEFWCVRYYFGSSVWEFDTTVVSYDGNVLVLNHSEDIRFINRRRFLRVAVKKQAFIARFPFNQSYIDSDHVSKNKPDSDLAKTSTAAWGPPEFVDAVVIELAGPGLRIESSLEVKTGDRVLVVLDLGQQRGSKSTKKAESKVVEDIGVVRHTRRIQKGLSIAVELTGLSDSNIDELIRATNTASLKVSDKNKNTVTLESTAGRVEEHANI